MITFEQISKNLQEELKTSGLSQAEIARRMNLSSHTIHCYFHGKKVPALDTFANLCKVLDLDPIQILCLDKN